MNVVVLMGRLTDNPELKHTQSNIAVTSFTLAVNRDYNQKDGTRIADFINVVAWRQTAEFVTKYFTKGQLVAVEGSIQTRRYQDKDGNNRTAFEVVASNVHFAEPKRDGGNGGYSPRVENVETASVNNSDVGDFTDISGEDDLPF